MPKQQTREDREQQNLLLRAYGYHWKREADLTQEQQHAIFQMYADGFEDQRAEWVLLSPLEEPVRKDTILQWLGSAGSSSEDVLAFLDNHGFVAMGKDNRQHWQIQAPSGNVINLKQALQEVERVRVDHQRTEEREREQKQKNDFEQSVQTLKAMLDLHGEAMNEYHAWGYSPRPIAKRLTDGTIEVTTYHLESEYHTEVFANEADVVSHLYSDGEGWWDPGTWTELR